MKKQILSLFVGFVLTLSLSINHMAFADTDISVIYNGQKISFDVPPQTINDRTMLPMRAIFEALGASVEWHEDIQAITSQRNKTFISLVIGKSDMLVNGELVSLDVAPCVINDRTLVPVRAIAEAFNLKVDWDENTKTVSISENQPTSITDYSVEYDSTNHMFKIYCGFKDANNQYMTYNGTAKITIKNNNDDIVYSKEHNIDASIFDIYTRKLTGNTPYWLCKIEIPDSDIQKSKKGQGMVLLDVSDSNGCFEQLSASTYDLPLLTSDELSNIKYDKSFTIKKYYSPGVLMVNTIIDSFEITKVELAYDNKLKVTYKITGMVSGSDYCNFIAKCYDADGFVIGTGTIIEKVGQNETFRFSDTFYIPDGTVKMEFVAD